MSTTSSSATAKQPWTYVKSRTFESCSVPVLQRAGGNGVALWIQAMYQFVKGLKPRGDGDAKKVVDVLFKADPAHAETDSACVEAMNTIMSLSMADKYYTRCMDDTLWGDGEHAGTTITLPGNFTVCSIDCKVIFTRAKGLASIATEGCTLDDLLEEPGEHFKLTNPEYSTSETFVLTVKSIVDWYADYYDRLAQAGGTAPSEATRCTHIRVALKHVCQELNVDRLLDFDKVGGDTGLVHYLLRLAKKKDSDGVKVPRSLYVGKGDAGHQNAGASGDRGGRNEGDRNKGNRNKGNNARRGTGEKNPGGRTCRQCGSEYHYARHCGQVPKAHRGEAAFLCRTRSFERNFWKHDGESRSQVQRGAKDIQLFKSDGFGGYEPYEADRH